MRYVLLGLITIGMMTYAVIDSVRTQDSRIRLGLPHWFWVAIIILLPFAGALTWLIVSAVMRRKYDDGPSSGPQRRPRGPLAPDDDPDFLFRLERDRRRAQQQRDAAPPQPADTGAPDPERTDEPGTAAGGRDPGDVTPSADRPVSSGAGAGADDEPLYVPEEFQVPDLLGEDHPAGGGHDRPGSGDDPDDPGPAEEDETPERDERSGRRSEERHPEEDENGRR
ncbi:PLDc N-terminal domain-containing protein [Pseudactinotalea sp. Z1748]|uniref:PLD nuclease N-terminal domain-containing protein n=1 Tax=Pseudactinotalea sp. Z1748 TaxID=3413027 RepID=UPI003C7CCD37